MVSKVWRRVRACALVALALVIGEACLAQSHARSTTPVAPAAVFVHGGGWVSGTPAMGDPMIGFFAARTIAFSAIDYPKLPIYPLSTLVDSVRRQLASSAKTGPLIVIGHSAGAHLAATAAFRPDAPTVRCLILLDGIGYDLVDLVTKSRGFRLRLGLLPEDATPWSPTALVAASPRRPAVYLAAGGDARATADQARAFAQVLKGQGLDVTLRIFPSAQHSDFLREFADPASPVATSVSAFLAAHPKCTGAA